MTSPFTLPSDLVDDARKERESASLSTIGADLDRKFKDGMAALTSVAGGVTEHLSPFAQALSEGGLKVPTLDDLTPDYIKQAQQKAQQAISTALTPPAATTGTPGVSASRTAPSGTPAAMPTGAPSSPESGGSRIASAGTRASRFAPHIAQVAREEGVPEDALAALIDVEDSGEDSVSPAGAAGLMQVVPGQGYDHPGEDARDPLTSIRQGARALKDKYRITGSWEEAGRAYFGYGTDAGGMDTNTYGARYDAARARYQGQMHPNAPPESPSSVAQTPQAQAQAPGQLTPDQSALDDPDKWSLCGPVAAVAMARSRGGNWTVAQAKQYAQQHGLWNADQGMGGLETEAQLLRGMGYAAQAAPLDWQKAAHDAATGNPVTLSTTFIPGGHYVVLEKFDPQTGKFYVGGLGTTLKKTTGMSSWMSPAELEALGGIQGALHFDNPASPTPSVAAVPNAPTTAGQPPSPSSGTSAGVQPAPADASPLDAARATNQGGGGAMMRQPIGQPSDEPLDGASSDEGAIQSTMTLPALGQPQRSDMTWTGNEPYYPGVEAQRMSQKAPLDPSMLPGDGGTAPQSAYDSRDADQGPRELAPPPQYGPEAPMGPNVDEAGPEQAPASPFKPLYDAAGAVVGYVQHAAEQAGATIANEGVAAPIARGILNTARTVAGRPTKTAEEDTTGTLPFDRAVMETARSLPANVEAARTGYEQGDYAQAGLGALGILGDLAPSTTLARQLSEMLPKADTPWGEIGVGDVVMTAAMVHGLATLGYGAVKVGQRVGAPIVRALREGVPAERFGQWLAANAERTAQADARMAREGSTVAPGAFGTGWDDISRNLDSDAQRVAREEAARKGTWKAQPDEEAMIRSEFGRRYEDPRVQLGGPSNEMLADAGRPPREVVRPNERPDMSGPVRIETDTSSRLNAGFGTVPEGGSTMRRGGAPMDTPKPFGEIGRRYSQQEMLDAGADGYLRQGVRLDIPIDKIDGFEPAPAGEYARGKPVTNPVELAYNPDTDTYTLYGGNHRVAQAILNGESSVPAFVEGVSQRHRPRPGATSTESGQYAEDVMRRFGDAGPTAIEPPGMTATAGALPATRSTDRLGAVNRALGQGVASTFSGGISAATADQLGDPNDPNRQAKAFVAGALAPTLVTRGVRAGLKAAGKDVEGARGALSVFGGRPANEAASAAPNPVMRNMARQMAGQHTPSGIVNKRGLAERWAQAWTDDRAGIRNFQEAVSRTIGRPLSAGESVAELTRVNPASVASQRLEDGLKGVLSAVGDDEDYLAQYLVHSHNVDVAREMGQRAYTEAIAAGATPQVASRKAMAATNTRQFSGDLRLTETVQQFQDIEQRVKGLPGGADRWQAIQNAAQGVWDFNRQTLERKKDAGIISDALYTDLTTKYPKYVRTDIADYFDKGTGGPAPGGKRLGLSDIGIQKISAAGTTKERVNPLLSTIDQTYSSEAAIARNEAGKAFEELVRLDPSWQSTFKEVVPTQGVNRGNPATTVPSSYTLKNGEQFLRVWDKGQARSYVVPPEYAALVSPQSGRILGDSGAAKLLTSAMNVYKSLITSKNPAFSLIVSPLRDAGDYAIREGALSAKDRGPLGFVQGAASAIGAMGDYAKAVPDAFAGILEGTYKGDLARMMREGAGQGARPGHDQKDLRSALRELQSTGGMEVKSAGDAARLVGNVLTLGAEPIGNRLEQVPRLAAARRAERRGAAPLGQAMAFRDATVDFQRAGEWSRVANSVIPFFNVAIQGGAQTVRTARQNPMAFMGAVASTVGTAAMAAEAWNNADEQRAADYQDVPDYLKKTGIVIMLPGMEGGNERGDRLPNYAWVPTGQYGALVQTAKEAARNYVEGKPGADLSSPSGWAQLGAEVAGIFTPIRGESVGGGMASLIPPGLSTGVEVLAADKDLFRGSTIATDRKDEQASALSQGSAAAFNAVTGKESRPSQWEYAYRDLGGYGATLALEGSNILAEKAGIRQPKQEDRIQNTPIVGGLINRVVRDSGGQRLQDATEEVSRVPEGIRPILEEAGLRRDELLPVPSQIQKVPLTRAEQEEFQTRTNDYMEREVSAAERNPNWRKPGEREKLVREAVSRAREKASMEVLRTISPSDRRQRLRQQDDKKAS